MKKKIFTLIFLAPLIITVSLVFGQDKEITPTPLKEVATPTKGATDKIQELKDRVASRVAELKKEKLGPLTGTIKSTSDGVLILISNNTEYSVQLDEEAKVYSIDNNLKKKEVKLTDIEKNSYISIIGTIDKEQKTAIAKVIVAKSANQVVIGKVTSISTKDSTITLTSAGNKTYTVDIDTDTTINTFDLQKETFTKISLSKIETDSRIHVYAVIGKEENKVTALRILVLPSQIKAGLTPEVSVSPTGTKTTVSPSPKTTPKVTPQPTKS